jgi:hypothetical protein
MLRVRYHLPLPPPATALAAFLIARTESEEGGDRPFESPLPSGKLPTAGAGWGLGLARRSQLDRTGPLTYPICMNSERMSGDGGCG